MKKIVAIILSVLVLCSVSAFAAGETCMRFEIGEMPEAGGWISVREYTGAVEAGGTVKVTVYNDSDTEFYCFLSARETEKWDTVTLSEFVYISPHTSEDVEMTNLADNAYFYLLELRALASNTTIYIAGSGKPDYTKTEPMSDLLSAGIMKAGTVAKMPANAETPATATPTATPEITPTPTATAEVTATATAQATEVPAETPTATAEPINDGKSNVGWIIAAVAAVVVIGGGACVYFFVIKKKK